MGLAVGIALLQFAILGIGAIVAEGAGVALRAVSLHRRLLQLLSIGAAGRIGGRILFHRLGSDRKNGSDNLFYTVDSVVEDGFGVSSPFN